jgi:hypothetical protein
MAQGLQFTDAPQRDPSYRYGWPHRDEEERAQGRRAGYVAAIVVNGLLMYAAHHLLAWGVPFVTPAFADILWAIDLSLLASIVVNGAFLGYDARWFRNLGQIGMTAVSIYVGTIIYAIFPFDFGSDGLNEALRTVAFCVIFALAIALVVQIVVFFVDRARRGLALR